MENMFRVSRAAASCTVGADLCRCVIDVATFRGGEMTNSTPASVIHPNVAFVDLGGQGNQQ
ncbi:unnamed protein product [Discosporangium mesarthrocarpum]